MSRRTWLAAGAGAVALAALRAERSYAAAVAADPRAADLAEVEPREVLQVPSGDAVLHVEVHGPEGAPTVVLSHGWTCSTRFWVKQLRSLASDLRVVVYDQRGHARSTGAPSSFSVDALGDDLQAVLEAVLADGEQAVLVGHSMGAMSVAAWAGRHPDEVQRRASAALLLSTGVDRLSRESTFLPLPARLAPLQAHVQGRILGSGGPLPGRTTVLLTKWFSVSPLATPAEVDLCAQLMRSADPRSRARWSRVMGDLDLLDALAHLTVPTTVVVGSADRLTPPVYAARVAAALPSLVELVELPGVGHMTPLEAPDTVEALVRTAVSERLAA